MNRRIKLSSSKLPVIVVSLIWFLVLAGCQSGSNLFSQPMDNQSPASIPSLEDDPSEALTSSDNRSEFLHSGDDNHGTMHPSNMQSGSGAEEENPSPADLASESKAADGVRPSNHDSESEQPMAPQTDRNSPEKDQVHPNELNEDQIHNHEPESSSASPSQNKLMGIKIGDTVTRMIHLHGEAVQQYTMADENNPITVYVYDGFEVGFNPSQRVEYVDVHSSQVDPGLNGIRIHQTVEEAIAALGTPDTNTQFVLNYMTDEVVLKMDIDPRNNKINSIKLFAAK